MGIDPTKLMFEAPKEKKIWFRAKTYGYGWIPVTWKGWGLVGLYLVFVLYGALGILSGVEGGLAAVKHFLLKTAVLTFFLLYFTYTHGEKLKWHWGKTNTEHDINTKK